jgi:putative DNA-invertase from lambdoid prophage Rac
VSDEGVSGIATKLCEREQGKRLFDMLRAGDTLVVRWVDRLGRNYTDVVDTIREFMRRGVIIKAVINGMTFDGSTTDPMQQAVRDALIAFMAATAQAQAEAAKSAQRAGIEYSRMVKRNTYLGRKPSYDRATFDRIRLALGSASPPSLSVIAKAERLSKQTVFRLKQDPQAALAALGRVGLVTAETACASRRYASISRRVFLSLCLSILNLKRCQTDLKSAV